MWTVVILGAAVVAAGVALMRPIQRLATSVPVASRRVLPPPSPERTPVAARPLNLLFIHHSVGGQLLADRGTGAGQDPRGGGLRRMLEGAGYRVHTATYGSRLGEKTDLFDWPEKFSRQMSDVLTTADGTQPLANGERHDVVMFKACFPNNALEGQGAPPGDPHGPALTMANAKAALNILLPEFQKYPKTLFVYLTAPPIAPKSWPEPAWKWLIKAVLGRTATRKMTDQATLARQLNDWVAMPDGWLKDYPLKNVAVIDYYDMLTGHGASNFLHYPTGDGSDSHPSADGQAKAAPEVLSALNAAVRRSGIAASAAQPHAPSQDGRQVVER